MDIGQQIDEILQDLPPPKEEPSEVVEEKVEETPKEEAPKEELREESKEEAPEEKKVEEAKGEVLEEAKEPEREKAPLPSDTPDERVQTMQDTINRMAETLIKAGISYDPSTGEVQRVAPVEGAPASPMAEVDVDLSKFKIIPENVDFDDVVGSRDAFENFFRDVLNRYEQVRVRRDALTTPVMVSNQVQRVLALKGAVDNFYQQNEDLVSVKPLVGAYANQLVAAHPDWTLPKVLEESAKLTRGAIGVKPGQSQQTPSKVAPSFAKAGGARQTKPKVGAGDKLQQEITELFEDI